MTTMKIEYRFNLSEYLNRGCLDSDYVESGIRIMINDVIITKISGNESDDGFRGENIVSVLAGWASAVPDILSGRYYRSLFFDTTETIDFTPKNDVIYIRYWDPEKPECDGPDLEAHRRYNEDAGSFNRMYPNYPEGTPVSSDVLVNEIIRVCEEFLAFITPYDKNQDRDIAYLRKELKILKNFWIDADIYPDPDPLCN